MRLGLGALAAGAGVEAVRSPIPISRRRGCGTAWSASMSRTTRAISTGPSWRTRTLLRLYQSHRGQRLPRPVADLAVPQLRAARRHRGSGGPQRLSRTAARPWGVRGGRGGEMV